jgi:hypothetical protein
MMFLVLLYFFTMPEWLARSGLIWMAITAAGIAVLIPGVRRKLLRLSEKFPARLKFVGKWIGQFDRSLTACTGSGRNFIEFVLITIVI